MTCQHNNLVTDQAVTGEIATRCCDCGDVLAELSTPMGKLYDPQPLPTPNAHPASWSLVIADMAQRDVFGAGKYNTRLQPHNGRDTLTDAYQEALDLAVYLRTAIFERDGK